MEGVPTTFWGKFSRMEGDKIAWHPLEHHCADVAACCEALLQHTLLGVRLARMTGQENLTPTQVARLCGLACLHDAGKLSYGFYSKVFGDSNLPRGHQNEFLLGLIDPVQGKRLQEALHLKSLSRWTSSLKDLEDLLYATVSHHGSPVPGWHSGYELLNLEACWKPRRDLDPVASLANLVERTQEWFPEAWAPGGDRLPCHPEFQHFWSGLVNLADWIGSDSERFFPFSTSFADRMPFSRERALEALGKLGLLVSRYRSALKGTPVSLDQIAESHDWSPTPAQNWILRLQPSAGGGAAVLEAPTGSGKTEAGILYFLKLFQAGLVDGLYFALPTRTAATQIQTRLVEALQRAFPQEDRPPCVLAVPGYLKVDDKTGQPLLRWEVLWENDPNSRYQYLGWAAENPKRYLAAPVAVGTIDQVLLSTLRVKHSHLRSASLSRQLLIVDEVHASDTYMTRLLESVLENHLQAGGQALLMSATLAAAARSGLLATASRVQNGQGPELSQGPVSFAEAEKIPFPSLHFSWAPYVISDRGRGQFKKVEIAFTPALEVAERIADQALRKARRGARVLIVRNTVLGCLEVQQELEKQSNSDRQILFQVNGRPAPHHSRYAREDRILLDKEIERALGKGRVSGPFVIVGTQTLEQSLDLDADFLITDLCPMDVLLQRLGRLHRHSRERRPASFETARCVLLVPDLPLRDMLKTNGQARARHGLGSVYPDLRVLQLTWDVLRRNPELSLPDMNRQLVEGALHPHELERLAESDPVWNSHAQMQFGKELADRQHAKWGLVRRDLGFSDPDVLFQTQDQTFREILTRLGQKDRKILFAEPLPESPFLSGERISEINVPARLVADDELDLKEKVTVSAFERGFRFQVGSDKLRYDRLGLRKEGGSEL